MTDDIGLDLHFCSYGAKIIERRGRALAGAERMEQFQRIMEHTAFDQQMKTADILPEGENTVKEYSESHAAIILSCHKSGKTVRELEAEYGTPFDMEKHPIF